MPAKKTTPKKPTTKKPARNTEAKVTNSDLKTAVRNWRRDASPAFRNLLDAEPIGLKPTKKKAAKKK